MPVLYTVRYNFYNYFFRFYFASCCDINTNDENDIEVISNPVFEAIEAEEEDNSIDDEGNFVKLIG